MRKRIAFITHESPLTLLGGVDAGGQVVYVDKVTRQLPRLGYEIDIFTRREDTETPQVVTMHKGIRVIHITAGPKKHIKKEELLPYYQNEFTKKLLQFMKREDRSYELVHANFFIAGIVASEIKKTFGIPFVITFHALGKVRRIHQGKADEFPDERFTIEEQLIQQADHIIAECPQDREDLIYYYHANQDKISVIPCGFDPHEFYPMGKQLARKKLGLPSEEKIILQLGRMVPRKGVDDVIVASAKLVKKQKFSLRLLIVGGETDIPDFNLPEIKRLRKIAAEEDILDHIMFTGRKNREQLKYYYNASDIFISTPWYEPFGITPLEAMACGTPVIGSNVGGIKFTILDGQTGLLVPAKDPQVLANNIELLLEDTKQAEIISKNALRRVKTFFTWATIARSISTLYEKVLLSTRAATSDYQYRSNIINTNFTDLIQTLQLAQEQLHTPLLTAANVLSRTLSEGNKVLVCGNGGSASDAQHFASELIGHFLIDQRPALPILSLTADTSVLTAMGNDFSYQEVFSRQVEAYGKSGDVLVAISTSGVSGNVIRALKVAR